MVKNIGHMIPIIRHFVDTIVSTMGLSKAVFFANIKLDALQKKLSKRRLYTHKNFFLPYQRRAGTKLQNY